MTTSPFTDRWTEPRRYPAEASVAAFPLGGIGTGTVSLGARGELRDWEISNHPDKGTWLPFTFFAIRAQPHGEDATSRILEARVRHPYEGDSGLHIGKVGGLPRLRDSTLHGEYPLAHVEFADDDLPVQVSLDAFTPLVPLDVEASGIPGAVFRYSVSNPGDSPVDVTVVGSMSNPIGISDHNMFQMPIYTGNPAVGLRSDDGLTGLEFTTDLPHDHLQYGTATLATAAGDTTATPQWSVNFWQDGVQQFWDDFTSDGRLEEQPPSADELGEKADRLPKLRTGSLGVVATIAPGASHDFEFVITWHSPNRSRAWNGMVGLPNTRSDEVINNHYVRRFADAWEVARHLTSNLPQLETATRAFHRSLHQSTLPYEVIDATASTLVVLRSTTCFLLDDGTDTPRFAAWEGSFDHTGSCEGTCTHVWNYAQSIAWLFPSLERSARRTEFLNETLPDGRMRFRNNAVFGNEPLDFHAAVDGQLGTIVRLYREWRFSGDDEFLTELWPHAQRALDFAFTHWDSNGDLVLDSQQHNTYDIEFYGEDALGSVMFYAALRAGSEMAATVGDHETAQRYAAAASTGAATMDDLLWNGEFYRQRTAEIDRYRYQYGEGCLSDQLLGQTFAHLTGLGHLLPVDHVRSAVGSIFRHNFRSDFATYHSVQRTYALNEDRGLILCSWPVGGRPKIPFVYSDEVWSGIEYQVATHLIYEGLVDEGLEIVRAVRERHDGRRRNPWNEAECGNHYARSLASWGVLIALTGTQWDGRTKTLTVTPHAAAIAADGTFRTVVTTATGWGELTVAKGQATLTVEQGSIELAEGSVTMPDGSTAPIAVAT